MADDLRKFIRPNNVGHKIFIPIQLQKLVGQIVLELQTGRSQVQRILSYSWTWTKTNYVDRKVI